MSLGKLDALPRVALAHAPTPLEDMPNLTRRMGAARLMVKRDDCTGLALGGNKARQLEFYIGQALAENADTMLITGAVQSNFVRSCAAAARKAGMDCHVQLEERVANPSPAYRHSGNVLLDRLLGATVHGYPEGEDEAGADRNLETIADGLRAKGHVPYVIHLGPGHPPWGALGYVVAAREILGQLAETGTHVDEIVVASGSGATHAGLLFGLRALDSSIPVRGICVRRTADLQRPRLISHCVEIAALLDIDNPVSDDDIVVDDGVLPPGYGKINDQVLDAIKLAARAEGIVLDPVYTGRTMAGLLNRARRSDADETLLFVHTGGQAAVFAYEEALAPLLDAE